MDMFLAMCDIHLITHTDVMAQVFLRTLVGPTYYWFLSFPISSITFFNDLEDVFLSRYV